MKFIQRVVILGCLALLPACSAYNLQELRHTPPKGTPHQAALSLEYLRFSEDAARNVDWGAAGYFSQKGLDAAYGHDVAPEELDNWYIPPEQRPALEQARAELMQALTAENVAAHPQAAAKAQLSFDCWVRAADGHWSEDRTNDCRTALAESLKVLKSKPQPMAEPIVEPAPTGEEEVQQAPQASAYIIFFGTNEAELDAQGQQTVGQVAVDIQQEQRDNNYTIVLNGHTDTVGAGPYNFKLSLKRAESVKKALMNQGILEKQIHLYGFGETDPAMPTPDNTAEPKNRRVEIFLGG